MSITKKAHLIFTEDDYNKSSHKGSIHSCSSAQTLDRIINEMLYFDQIDMYTAKKIWSFFNRLFEETRKYHTRCTIAKIENKMKEDIMYGFKIKEINKLETFISNLNLPDTIKTIYESYLKNIINTFSDIYFVPIPRLKRMSFYMIRDTYGFDSLFHNKKFKTHPQYTNIMKSIIINTYNKKTYLHDHYEFEFFIFLRDECMQQYSNQEVVDFMNTYTSHIKMAISPIHLDSKWTINKPIK